MIKQIQKVADEKHEAGEPLPAQVRVRDFQASVEYFSHLANLKVGDPDKPAQILSMRLIEDSTVPEGAFRVYDNFDHLLHEGKIEEG